MTKLFVILFLLLSPFARSQNAEIVYKKIASSTVTIETDVSLGSGFVIDSNKIITNYHVIKGAKKAMCYVNDRNQEYEIDGIIAEDQANDLVLLSVPNLNIRTSIKLSSESFKPGQKIYVIGSPKGLPATISDGIISGLRDFDGLRLIQITAPISSGSSGGPVLNDKAELIGVAVAQLRDGQNLNFAIPKNNIELLLSFSGTSIEKFNKNFDKINEDSVPSKKNEKVELYNNAYAAFKDDRFSEAVKLFEVYKEKYPDEIYGYYWSFKAKAVIDEDMSQSLAITDALSFISIAENNKEKNKFTLMTVYGYMAGYSANIKKDFKEAIIWLDKMIDIDPNNMDAIKNRNILQKAISSRRR